MTDFSYQLYCSRKFPPLTRTLPMLAEVGYKQVEGYGALYADDELVDQLKAHLANSGLTMPSGHFSLDMLEDETDKVLEIAGALGIETIYCPFLQPDRRPTDAAGYEAFGKRLEKAGKPIRDAGLGFGWHNHDFEFRALDDGSVPMEAIFHAGPSLEWEADLAWVIKGGADPLDWIRRHGDRITSVHIKDIAATGECAEEDGWADVGHGTVDWAGLMAAVRKTPVKYFIMEHDNPSDDARFARRSLAAAQAL